MKKAFVLLALTLSASFSHAIHSSTVSTLVNSDVFKALETEAQSQGLQLDSITDTGARFRCMCNDVNVVFKNSEGKSVQKTLRISQDKVSIAK